MLKYFLWPYRRFSFYSRRPLASRVVFDYLRQQNYPTWTSFFIRYRNIQDDQIGEKHFNFQVDQHNYHILRVGCFPFIKYHCTKRPIADLTIENRLYRLITICNLGIPCLIYGISAIFLIRHTDYLIITINDRRISIPIYFLILEDHH